MGTRIVAVATLAGGQDHPHAYGDKTVAPSFVKILQGSSPRVWGQVIRLFCPVSYSGIIPTRMGTSILHTSLLIQAEDHPHAYGDKLLLFITMRLIKGSSPRVWGQVFTVSADVLKSGIIPTRMGTSFHIFVC